MFGLESLKKLLIEKYLGRLITIGLAALGGLLVGQGLDHAVVASWVDATQALIENGVPIIIAVVLDQLQHKVALATDPNK